MFLFLSRYWWVLVLRGVAAVLFGILAFTLPFTTLAALILVFGAYAFVDGSFALVAAIAGSTITADWWVVLLHGAAGVGIGMLTLFNPALTGVMLLLYIAGWAIAVGALQIVAAVKLRRELTGEWWLALGGAVAIAFGLLMLWRPGQGALVMLWLLAGYAIVWGMTLMVGGFEIRRARTRIPIA